jgi:hypothetical protein
MAIARDQISTPWLVARPAAAFAVLVALLLVIYGRDIGHGFVKDDVAWVSANRVASWQDVRALAGRSNGFYRPLVAASFALDRALYGVEPFGYGVTNLLLLIASAAALAWAARGVGLTAMAAVIAAAIWTLNFQGIHMAVLWLSGRTELWLVLCAFLSAGALARERPLLAGLAALAAMLAKEEAVMLPAMLTAWAWVLQHRPRADDRALTRSLVDSAVRADAAERAADDENRERADRANSAASPTVRARAFAVVRLIWPAWIALAVYFALRARTGAYTPATSPWFYQFTFDPFRVVTNAGEYLDRACTFSVLTVIVCALLAWQRPAWTPRVQRLGLLALIWLVGGYALTVFLPVRSSLYACFPSMGVAMLAALLIESLWLSAPAHAGVGVSAQRRMLAAIVLPVLLVPVYWSRNERWVELADLGADTFTAVRQAIRDTPDARHLVIEDDRGTRCSLLNTYGALLPTAVTLALGRPLPVWLDPPPDDWRGSELVSPPPTPSSTPTNAPAASAPIAAPVVTLALTNGRLVRVRRK